MAILFQSDYNDWWNLAVEYLVNIWFWRENEYNEICPSGNVLQKKSALKFHIHTSIVNDRFIIQIVTTCWVTLTDLNHETNAHVGMSGLGIHYQIYWQNRYNLVLLHDSEKTIIIAIAFDTFRW